MLSEHKDKLSIRNKSETGISYEWYALQRCAASYRVDFKNEFYLPDELKATGKANLPHLGELTPITDEMSDEEKLAIIQCEFDRFYGPRHPVRNNLETLDSVEVVRTIREVLKR